MTPTLLTYLSSVLCLMVVSTMTSSIARTKFKAAVYEHEFVAPPKTSDAVSRTEALQHMQVNLDVYHTQVNAAKQQGADIIVFPEDGLYGYKFIRKTIRPYLEYIPDPEKISWSACDEPNRFPNTDVQRQLSCMAKNNSIYLVANMGDVQKCHTYSDRSCPQDGVFQYNTAVAFDPSGKLVARYHKRNLYSNEFQFDQPPAEVKYFDTPFGRFGLFICFDILYKSPAVDMVKVHKISNVVFPTAWMDSLPLLSAIGWHSSFARGQGVNLLVANLHRPSNRFQGSGIYTPQGMADFYYSREANGGPKLIVKEIDVLDISDSTIGYRADEAKPISDVTSGAFENKNFNFVPLTSNSGSVKVCRYKACCSLDYSFLSHNNTDLIALGAFDGLFHDKYYSKICAVLKCPEDDREKCGSYTFSTGTSFRRASLRASNIISSSAIFPQVLASNDGRLELTDAKAWSWSLQNMTLKLNEPLQTPLLAMAIVAREYDKDPVTDNNEGGNASCNRSLGVVIFISLLLSVSLSAPSYFF